MSHFTSVTVDYQQKQEDCFIDALKEVFGANNVEVSDKGLALFGYQGDDRSKKSENDPNYAPLCHIRINRKGVGSASNDIGYRRNEDGSYQAFVSEYDSGANFSKSRQDKLKQHYTCSVTQKTLKARGYTVKVTKDKGGLLKISASKFSK
jgi:hypothetical protein